MADLHASDASIIDVEAVQEPPSDKAVINLANHLLKEFSIPTRIEDVSDISASLFVVLYESLFSDRLPGIIRQPVSKEDEIHNCQIVIDVLSTDVVRDSLSHIRGADIVAGENTAILNLLDIFSYLLEYVVKRIENNRELNDTSSACPSEPDTEASIKDSSLHESKSATEKMQDMPKSKLGRTAASNMTNNNSGSHLETGGIKRVDTDRNENRKAFDAREIITHEDFYAMSYGGITSKNERPPSPIQADLSSQSFLGQKTVYSDVDSELAPPDVPAKRPTEGPSYKSKVAWEAKPSSDSPGPSETVIDGVTLRARSRNMDEPQWESTAYSVERPIPSFSATMPAPQTKAETSRADPLRSTVGPIHYHTQTTDKHRSESRIPSAKGLSSSYNDLRELVERTAALTRVALATSPVRGKTAFDLDVTDILSDRPRPVIPSQGARLAKELNAKSLSSAQGRARSPDKASKKVAFASLHESGIHAYGGLPENDVLYKWQSSPGGYSSDLESDCLYDQPPRTRRPASAGSQTRVNKSTTGGQKKSSKTGASNQKFAKYLAQNRQPELGAAHMTLRTEDRAIRRKQELLKKFYEQDHKEFAEDVEYLLERDRQRSKELEEEYIKKCATVPAKKKIVKSGKAQTHKKPRISKPVKSKSDETASVASAPLPLKIESEEDLLPALLDEFPNLHLSEHTWHELWRRGLHQIEAVTRSHHESQRKKSRAKCQLEEAAERHGLLADIMKKQLDHAKRMRDIKEQKQQQISTRNKMHEKRIQSARARRYYNEYQVRARAKQLKRRTKEEMVFRELFKDALSIQKERIRDVRQYATDQRKIQESKRQNEIDSLENFYHDQFEMLADKMSKERIETEVRDAAQQKIMQQLKKELRKKMESEIEQYQEELFRDEDDVHFRKCDADRVLRQLHLARYSAKI